MGYNESACLKRNDRWFLCMLLVLGPTLQSISRGRKWQYTKKEPTQNIARIVFLQKYPLDQ
jgi:hypothetical protein